MDSVSNRSDDFLEFKDPGVMKAVCREPGFLNHQASFQYCVVLLIENGSNGEVINSSSLEYKLQGGLCM